MRKFNLLKAYVFILEDLNFSINYVDYFKFKNERLSMMRDYLRKDKEFDKEKNSEVEEDTLIARSGQQYSKKDGFINNVIWMLEYNRKGLMTLVFFIFHICLVMRQMLRSVLYSYFPTTRDPITGEFLNRWLRLSETYYLIDFIHKIDDNGLLNCFIAITMLQYFILRIRAFFMRLETARKNKYHYKQINCVDMDFGHANEVGLTFKEYIEFSKNLFAHQCQVVKSFSGLNRKLVLRFNQKMKNLNKTDRNIYYNQINFIECFQAIDCLEEYRRKINSNCEQQQAKSKSTTTTDENNMTQNTTWFQYIFSFNLPNRLSYVGSPGYRLDPVHLVWLFGLFLISASVTLILLIIVCIAIAYVGLIDGIETRRLNFSKFNDLRFIEGFAEHFINVLVFLFNICDCGLLPMSAVHSYSRCDKVSKLLWKEVEFYRDYLREFASFYDNYKYISKVRELYLSHLDQTTWLYYNKLHPHCRVFGAASLSFIHQPITEMNTQDICCEKERNFTEFDLLIQHYKIKISSEKIARFNEDIDYILDLIEGLQYELMNNKRIFTTYLNINMIFGTVSSSVALYTVMYSTNRLSNLLPILAVFVGSSPLAYTLGIGALTQKAVSLLVISLITNQINLIQLILYKLSLLTFRKILFKKSF